MKKTLLALAALVCSAFSSLATGIDRYDSGDFTPLADAKTHALKLNAPIEFGAEDWTLKLRVRIGTGVYVNKDKDSWGSTLIASGPNPFPEYFDPKPFQLFIPIANTKDAQHLWGGIPKLDAKGNPTIEGITYVLGSEQMKDGSRCPKAGETWEFVITYKASTRMLSSYAYDVDNKPQKVDVKRKDVSRMTSRVEQLSTSVLPLKGWKISSLTVNLGNVPETNPAMQYVLVGGGAAAAVALLALLASRRRKKKA